jgi:hypothetical protein
MFRFPAELTFDRNARALKVLTATAITTVNNAKANFAERDRDKDDKSNRTGIYIL